MTTFSCFSLSVASPLVLDSSTIFSPLSKMAGIFAGQVSTVWFRERSDEGKEWMSSRYDSRFRDNWKILEKCCDNVFPSFLTFSIRHAQQQ